MIKGVFDEAMEAPGEPLARFGDAAGTGRGVATDPSPSRDPRRGILHGSLLVTRRKLGGGDEAEVQRHFDRGSNGQASTGRARRLAGGWLWFRMVDGWQGDPVPPGDRHRSGGAESTPTGPGHARKPRQGQ